MSLRTMVCHEYDRPAGESPSVLGCDVEHDLEAGATALEALSPYAISSNTCCWGSPSVSVLTSMPSTLPAALLRAVPSAVALEGYGKHWSRRSQTRSNSSNSELAQVCDKIDDFISRTGLTSVQRALTRWRQIAWLVERRSRLPAKGGWGGGMASDPNYTLAADQMSFSKNSDE
eukprot:TRINITY_DN9415_c0_g1_i6.p1 TRINITY_DN9415_c0_g1~~TRINITY_DN9415_c0_g1_i6.p1  ORF type:complete len:174 (-),score=17.72 TRINITY_DN9415_c0_g1_i6:332-853(-)